LKQKFLKPILIGFAIIIGVIWLIVAIGFAFFGMIGFIITASEKGFRQTLCGTQGCTDTEFLHSILWLSGVTFVIYIIPIIIIYFIFRKRT
jgi:hypothetical protein